MTQYGAGRQAQHTEHTEWTIFSASSKEDKAFFALPRATGLSMRDGMLSRFRDIWTLKAYNILAFWAVLFPGVGGINLHAVAVQVFLI